MVATFYIPEIAVALAEFVADPEPYLIRFDPPLDLRAIAAEVQLLPAVLDMGGCLGQRPFGEVASFLWDEPRQLRPERDDRMRNLAYHRAALEYPVLAPLVPRRPPDAVVCSHCGGSGRCAGLPDQLADVVVCYCGGLGWLPSNHAEPSALVLDPGPGRDTLLDKAAFELLSRGAMAETAERVIANLWDLLGRLL